MAKCIHCDNTGSLSKDIFRELDCVHCDVALERVQLEGWLEHQGIQISAPEAWLIFSSGKTSGIQDAIKVCEAIQTDFRDQYKGRGKHAPNNPHRAHPHMDGQSDGAMSCVDALEGLK